MKRLIFFVAIGVMLFSSCSQFDAPTYSCDKTIDSWVKDNLSEIQVMSRGDWLEIEDDFQLPIYRAFTPKQRFNFWITKFEEVLQLEWTEEEKAHINQLIGFVVSHSEMFYDGDIDEALEDEIELFQYQWCEYARTKFNWTNNVIYAIAATGKKMIATDGIIKNDLNVNAKSAVQRGSEAGSGYTSNCICNKDDDWCGITDPHYDCKSSNCKDTNFGCGWLLLKDCDGDCVHDAFGS